MSIKQFISSLLALQGNFANDVAQGLSLLGTVPTVALPDILPSNQDTAASWKKVGPASQDPPNTGVTRKYDLTVTREYIAPDGFNRSSLLINGQFPGPTIEANWGDMIQVTVHNKIQSGMIEGVTLHWHGLNMKKTPWYDGVPGVGQCPIAPGSTFTYTFQADQYGTSWYHSHYSAQYTDGLYGPMVIHGPKDKTQYDIDLGPVVLQDYFHTGYYQQNQLAFQKPPAFPNLDNNLINGKGITLSCPDGSAPTASGANGCKATGNLAKFNFTSGKTHRLRLINSGSGSSQYFRIDGHKLTVIANDFVPVVPYQTDVVTVGIGQRTDILVTANGKDTDAVWMRSNTDAKCSGYNITNPLALAAIYYPKANRTSVPKTSDAGYDSGNCGNDALSKTVPQYPLTPGTPSTRSSVDIIANFNQSGNLVFFVNNSQFMIDYNTPILLAEKQGQRTFPAQRNVYDFGSNSSVQLIVRNEFPMPHPMHIHGHNFWVLAEGVGEWDGTVVNPQNPQRRDTQVLQPGTPAAPSYIVLQWNQDNPGAWPFHCHTAVHASAGLFSMLLEQPEKVQKEMQIPAIMQQTCDDWNRYTSKNTVDQIDSGV